MWLAGPFERWAELLKVQLYPFAPTGTDFSITEFQHLQAWEKTGWRKAEVNSILGLQLSTPALLCGRNAKGRWDYTVDSLSHLGLSFPICKMGTFGLSVSKAIPSGAFLEFKV